MGLHRYILFFIGFRIEGSTWTAKRTRTCKMTWNWVYIGICGILPNIEVAQGQRSASKLALGTGKEISAQVYGLGGMQALCWAPFHRKEPL